MPPPTKRAKKDGVAKLQQAEKQAKPETTGEETKRLPPASPRLRGLYEATDAEVDPLADTAIYEDGTDGMLRFTSKDECMKFVKKHCVRGSNPDFPFLQHIFSLLVTWDQVQSLLIDKIDYFNAKHPHRRCGPIDESKNVYLAGAVDEAGGNNPGTTADVLAGVRQRLDLPFHKHITPASTLNTLRYLFYHMRAGIFVMIRANKLVIFAPFCNKDYENDWEGALRINLKDNKLQGYTLKDYYVDKFADGFRTENIIPDVSKWWANGNIICNEHCREGEEHSQYWGDHFNAALRDLLEDACRSREIADCEFFINKRDYPHLKYNPTSLEPVEPYGFIYDKDDRREEDDVPLKRQKYNFYTPIVSFYCSHRFADLPFPTSEDWEAATGMVYPKSFYHTYVGDDLCVDAPRDLFTEENFIKFSCDWSNKVDTAFFRGTATGGGVTVETNQRLKCAALSTEWSNTEHPSPYGGDPPFLNAAIVGWNKRDKKLWDQPMAYIDENKFDFKGSKANFTPIYEQSRYKYLIYIEGHCAACRYGFMMRMGSVILKVESRCVADSMWYFPILKPWEDHVPIKADLSDLAEKIQWCRDNDDKCKVIAARAKVLYDTYVHKEACLDYVQMISREINAQYIHPPSWWERPPPQRQPPNPVETGYASKLDSDTGRFRPCWEDHQTGMSKPCARCAEEQLKTMEAKERAEREKAEREKVLGGKEKKYRNRMKVTAKSAKKGKNSEANETSEQEKSRAGSKNMEEEEQEGHQGW